MKYKIEWTMLANYHVLTVTTPRGERIIHSSTNRKYLEKLVSDRYNKEVKYAF